MLRVRLLGQFAAELDDATVHAPSSRRAWSLLDWLALHPGLHPRGAVAARFWPDVLDASAKASLRSALWALRRALGPAGAAYLSCSRDLVGLRPGTPVQVDALVFDTLVAAGRLEEAAAMAAGEFLTGFDDEWVLEARDEHRAKLAELLEQLASTAVAGGDLRAALQRARRQASIDPFAEEPQRRADGAPDRSRDPATALAGYERIRQRLDRELGMASSLPPAASPRHCRKPAARASRCRRLPHSRADDWLAGTPYDQFSCAWPTPEAAVGVPRPTMASVRG